MPSIDKCRQVKTMTELGGKEIKWKNHIRIMKPPGGECHDILGLNRLSPRFSSGIRIVPPREILFPPEPKKVTLIKQRTRDRGSSSLKRCIAPDMDKNPVTESENNLAFGVGSEKIPALCGRARVDVDSSRIKLILSQTSELTTGDNENIGKMLQQNGYTTPSRFWTGKGSTKRRPPTCNDSSGVKKLLFRWDPDEHARKQSALKDLIPRKLTAINRDSYSHNLGEALTSSTKDSVVWQPGRRLAYQFLMAKGFHAKKWEDDSLQRLLNKQRRNLTYSHHHWKSSVFGKETESNAIVGCNTAPYVYHNILWDGKKGVVCRFGKKCRSSEDVRNPVTGESITFNRRRSLFVNNSGDKSNEKKQEIRKMLSHKCNKSSVFDSPAKSGKN